MPTDESWLEGYKKHKQEWSDYTKRMRRSMFQIEHDFENEVCTKCRTHKDQVMAGSVSWLCQLLSTMPCCNQHGLEIYDYSRGLWVCNQCGATTSTDYFYPNFRKQENKPAAAPTTATSTKKKCTCTIQVLMSTGCKCNGV